MSVYCKGGVHCNLSYLVYTFFLIASGVGLSPLYCGHFWFIVPALDDRWGWLCSNWWNEDWQGKPKYSEKTCPSATLSTTNPTWPDLGSNPGRRGGKLATNRLIYGASMGPSVYSVSQTSHMLQHHHHVMTYFLTSLFEISRLSFQHVMAAKVAVPVILLNVWCPISMRPYCLRSTRCIT
jgi:hypothetical protein